MSRKSFKQSVFHLDEIGILYDVFLVGCTQKAWNRYDSALEYGLFAPFVAFSLEMMIYG